MLSRFSVRNRVPQRAQNTRPLWLSEFVHCTRLHVGHAIVAVIRAESPKSKESKAEATEEW